MYMTPCAIPAKNPKVPFKAWMEGGNSAWNKNIPDAIKAPAKERKTITFLPKVFARGPEAMYPNTAINPWRMVEVFFSAAFWLKS